MSARSNGFAKPLTRRLSGDSVPAPLSRPVRRSMSWSTRAPSTFSTSRQETESTAQCDRTKGVRMTKSRLSLTAILLALVFGLALVAAGCGGGDDETASSTDVTGSISIMAIWGGPEQEPFQGGIDGFTPLYPNVTVQDTPGG